MAADSVNNTRAFLDQYYHILSLNLEPTQFYTWLRQKGVFTERDEEEIKNKNFTTIDRMGALVDKIKTKGKKGFDHFMEVVEWVYPDVYITLMGKPAGEPIPDFRRISRAQACKGKYPRPPYPRPDSVEIVGQMAILIQTLVTTKSIDKHERNQLQNYVSGMQESILKEKADLYLQIKNANEQVTILHAEKFELNQKLEGLIREREDLSKELKTVQDQKEKYAEEFNLRNVENDALKVQVQKLQVELKKYRMHPPVRDFMDKENITGKLSKAEQENLVFSFEKAQLEGQLRVVNDRCAEVRKEKELVINQKMKLEEELNLESKKYQSLQSIYEDFRKKYGYMESEVVKLKKEIQELRDSDSFLTHMTNGTGSTHSLDAVRNGNGSNHYNTLPHCRSLDDAPNRDEHNLHCSSLSSSSENCVIDSRGRKKDGLVRKKAIAHKKRSN